MTPSTTGSARSAGKDPGPGPAAGQGADAGAATAERVKVVPGRMVSLQFMKSALRRRRAVWVATAVLGLVVGAGYHLVVPVPRSATAIVYLGHPTTGVSTSQAQDDLAMLDTSAVADRAVAALGERGLTAAELLGKAPGTLLSDSVLAITIEGRTPAQALARVNAVADAYLAYRSQQYAAQNDSIVAAANRQMAKLETRIAALSARIASIGTSTPSTVATLESQRAAATAEVGSLQGTVQQDQLNALSVTKGSKILSPGTLDHSSQKKTLAVDGLTGLVAGLGAGALAVVVVAVLSDRPRSREDVAELLDAPVDVSIRPLRRRWGLRRRPVLAQAARPDPALETLEHYLRGRLTVRGLPAAQLVVSSDDPRTPAASLVALGAAFAAAEKRVVLVDATHDRTLARALDSAEVGLRPVARHPFPTLTLLVPPVPWETEDDERWRYSLGALADADVVLVLATVDPAVGARHLRGWGPDAVVTATAGRSTAAHLGVVRELLDDAGVHIASAVLLGADPTDDSVGLPVRAAPPDGRESAPAVAATVLST